MNVLDFVKGYKLKLLGLVWAGLAIADGAFNVNILASVDASNWVDNVIFGIGVFAGRDALDTLVTKATDELKKRG